MRRISISLLTVLALYLRVGAAYSASTVITFEEFSGSTAPIPNGYFGFNWNTMWTINGSSLYTNSGYGNGAVSGVRTAYNGFVGPTFPMSVTGNRFNFEGAYFTAAWNDGLSINVEGYRSGTLAYTTTFTVNTAVPTFQALNYLDIDALRIRSSGGTKSPTVEHVGEQFAMDNFTFSTVPEPQAFFLIATGLVGLSWRRTMPRIKKP